MEEIDTKKFDTCRFRSAEMEEIGRRWCCGEDLHRAFICYERNIDDLVPQVCLHCNRYQSKLEI